MYGHLKLVTVMSYSVSPVESPILRGSSKHDGVFSFKYFKQIMFKLTKLSGKEGW